MDDPIDSAFQSRRFAHGKSKGKGKGKGKSGAKPFNPLAALGRYNVSLGTGTEASQHLFEIHELTGNENGLLGTLDFGKLSGMFVLCGSRSGLPEIIAELEQADDDAAPDEDSQDGTDIDDDDDDDDDEHDSEEADDIAGGSKSDLSAVELADERANRRARAFEKNSFRNPKFWMRWKGLVTPGDGDAAREKQSVSDMGYVVFANNACDKFEGTITCPSLGWKHLKMKGRKTTSKATPCPIVWTDII